MQDTTCSVDRCDNPVKRCGFCYGHYMKNWRYRTPTPTFEPQHADIAGQRFGRLVVIRREPSIWVCRCDCGATVRAGTHHLQKRGQSSCAACAAFSRRRDDAGYGAAHDRVRRERGSATLHRCVDCGTGARHWSYDHGDPEELTAVVPGGYEVAYSLDPDHYAPRCVPCHKRFDLGRLDAAAL